MDLDRKSFQKSAISISKALEFYLQIEDIEFERRLLPFKNDFGGWGVALTKTAPHIPSMMLFYDHLAGDSQKRFWYGFAPDNKVSLEKLIAYSPFVSSSRKISDADIIQGDHLSLSVPLDSKQAERPIIEIYETDPTDGEYYYGIHHLVENEEDRFPENSAFEFFISVIYAYPDFNLWPLIKSELEGFKQSATRETLKRASALILTFLAQKENNNIFYCEVCKFDPKTRVEDTSIVARSLLDVHHKIPLHQGPRYTCLDDLALLCPNCHRFVHAEMRMNRTK